MPRLRIVLLAALVTLLSGGLAAGIAWRWLVRDALARRAGQRLGRGALRRDLWPGLKAGLVLLPLTWSGVLLAAPILPSALADVLGGSWWIGYGALAAFFVAGVLTILLVIRIVYRRSDELLAGVASTAGVTGAGKRPFFAHVAGMAPFFAPALVVGRILLVSWPGLVALKLAVLCAAVAPGFGALAALPALLHATNAGHLPPGTRAARPRRALPRWAVAVGLIVLSFGWGVVGARLYEIAANRSPFLSARALERLGPALRRAQGRTTTFGNIVGSSQLAGAGLDCETDVVQWAPVGARAIGWCEQWIWNGGEGGRYGTAFFLTADQSFAEDHLPMILSRINLGVVDAVTAVPGGVVAVEQGTGAPESVPLVRDVVVLRPEGPELVVAARRSLPRGATSPDVWALGSDVVVDFPGRTVHDDRWLHFDRDLVPRNVSARERLSIEIGGLWLVLLVIAGLASAVATERVGRAGRIARALRRPRTGLFHGRLEPNGPVSVLHTQGGPSLVVDPGGAEWVGWPEGDRAGTCVVLGRLRAPGGGAYRSGPPVVHGGRPFAIVKGDFAEADTHAEALREASLRRSLPWLWALSLVPFAVVIASS